MAGPCRALIRWRGEFGEGCRESMPGVDIDAEFVVAAADVLDEGVPGTDDPGRAEPFESAHRPQPSLKPSVIGFDRVVGVLLGDMACGGCQLIERARVGRRPVCGDLARAEAVLEGASEEPASGCQGPLFRDQHVNNLPILVDGPVQIHPAPGYLDVGFIDEPAIAGRVSAGAGCVDQQRGEPLHPAIDRHVINGDTAFCQQPRRRDRTAHSASTTAPRLCHVRREAKAREPGLR